MGRQTAPPIPPLFSMWTRLKHLAWQWRGVLIATPSVAGVVLLLRFAGLLQLLEWSAYDQFMQMRPREAIDTRIVIVEINEADVRRVVQWPMPDAVLARLLEKIKQQQPKAIALDLYRDLPVEPGHAALVNVYRTTPNLIGIQKGVGNSKFLEVAPPPELSQRDQVGANDALVDADGKLRRSLLYLEDNQGNFVFTLGMTLALRELESRGITPKIVAGTKLQIGKALFEPFSGNDGGYMRENDQGYQVLLNYRGPKGSFQKLSMTDIMQNRVPLNLLRDRIVLIGVTAESLKDVFYTPYSSRLFGAPERMPGVETHANLTSQILSSALENRPLIKTWAEPVEILWIAVWAAIGATLSWSQRFKQGHATQWTPLKASTLLVAGGVLVGCAYGAFLSSWWIPVVPPLLALVGAVGAITVYVANTAGEIRKTFGRYLTDEVVASLLETPEGLKFGGERRKVTILMSDLRGFSATSERLPPEKVVGFLNIYLGVMADVITEYNGTIDEFIGDAILVIFGAPTQREDDAERAVACALAMQLAMEAVNEQIKSLDIPAMEMGIGINTGEVVVGNIGSAKRAKYGIVGNHVNLTGRIESYTVGGQILVSEFTLRETGDIFRIKSQMQVEPKGIKAPITLYDIGGITGKYNLELPQAKAELRGLAQPVPLHYTVLEDKHVVGTAFEGSLLKLSTDEAELSTAHPLASLSNIKITAIQVANHPSLATSPCDLYAKVVQRSESTAGESRFRIRFTTMPPEVAMVISELVSPDEEVASIQKFS